MSDEHVCKKMLLIHQSVWYTTSEINYNICSGSVLKWERKMELNYNIWSGSELKWERKMVT